MSNTYREANEANNRRKVSFATLHSVKMKINKENDQEITNGNTDLTSLCDSGRAERRIKIYREKAHFLW